MTLQNNQTNKQKILGRIENATFLHLLLSVQRGYQILEINNCTVKFSSGAHPPSSQ